MTDQPEVSIIIPARNEELNIGQCLSSLAGQDDVSFETFVVDDHSSDRTADLASGYINVKVISAIDIPAGWTGKANAINSAIPFVRGQWLLFTDADTVHSNGSLRRALDEAKAQGVCLLSYSPRQEIGSFWERAVQPVIFAELARKFSYDDVNDPESPLAAANGQYILISRNCYRTIGGHVAVKGSLLEDVDIARAAKRVGKIRFRFAPDAVSTRMYRNLDELVSGWTKNLMLLFPNSVWLAILRCFESLLLIGGPFATVLFWVQARYLQAALTGLVSLVSYQLFSNRLKRAGWSLGSSPAAVLGLPMLAYLLLKSSFAHSVRNSVVWKGRSYNT
jgi:glycosyltransferase involved in cell wall biosynthesis